MGIGIIHTVNINVKMLLLLYSNIHTVNINVKILLLLYSNIFIDNLCLLYSNSNIFTLIFTVYLIIFIYICFCITWKKT